MAVEPDRRIVFTWGCEGDGQAVPAGSSTVEITLAPVADGTEVRCATPACPPGSRPWRMWPAGGTPWPPWPSPGAADQLAPVLGERVADWLAA